jgi:hypothetical protein
MMTMQIIDFAMVALDCSIRKTIALPNAEFDR